MFLSHQKKKKKECFFLKTPPAPISITPNKGKLPFSFLHFPLSFFHQTKQSINWRENEDSNEWLTQLNFKKQFPRSVLPLSKQVWKTNLRHGLYLNSLLAQTYQAKYLAIPHCLILRCSHPLHGDGIMENHPQ